MVIPAWLYHIRSWKLKLTLLLLLLLTVDQNVVLFALFACKLWKTPSDANLRIAPNCDIILFFNQTTKSENTFRKSACSHLVSVPYERSFSGRARCMRLK